MPKKKKERSRERELKKQLGKELVKEEKRMQQLKLTNPLMFRRCGKDGKFPCCQAVNADGSPCNRAALTDQTYVKQINCCYLCWQHALGHGVYALLKLVKAAATSGLDWDTYCAYYPDECAEVLERQKEYS